MILKTECRENSIAIVSLLDLAPPESVCTTEPCEYLKKLSRRFTSCNGLYEEAPSERGTFFRPQVYYIKGKGLLEVHKRVRKSVFPSVKRPSRANRSIYGSEKVSKYLDFMILRCLNGIPFSAVKSSATF